MGGYNDHVAIMGDWMPPSPSPRSFFSSMLNDGIIAPQSLPIPSSENKSGALSREPEEQGAPRSVQQNDYVQTSVLGDEASHPGVLAESRVNSRGGLVERIAARAGFNAPRLNTENIRPADLSKNQEVRSPYLTIPPGLSPTTLLDSPVFLSNSLVQPSPTTGKISFAPSVNNLNSALVTDDHDKGKENTFEDTNASPFAFRTVAESVSFPSFNPANRVNPSGFAAQSFPRVGVSVHSDTSFLHQSMQPSKIRTENDSALFQQTNFTNSHLEDNKGSNLLLEQNYNSVGFIEPSPPLDEQNEDDGDQRDLDISGGPGEDGYNWRKYGQKQVKGSEYPRSYYKCTHPNCPVKKKVERSQEGHITEIIYKGAHNHPKPPPNRRSALGSSNAFGSMQLDSEQPDTGANVDPIWSVMQRERPDNLDSTLLGQEYSNGAAMLQGQNGSQYESGDGVEGSAAFSNDGEDDDDRATHGSVSLGYDGEGEESESKRRRIEAYAPEMSGPSRAIREPRVVVQTTSEVDILEDGYRWRKYGQKVVKGNPNPRSYYKCTSPGCNVRKHVERACHDLKSVITTYEGKHNHDVPAARNSGHGNHGASPNMHPPQQPPAPRHMPRPEPSQIHSNRAQFERPPSLGQFGLPNRPRLGPGPGFGYGMNQNGLASLVLAGLGPNQGKLPVLPVHPYLGQHQTRPMNGMGFMMPKGEPKLEPVTESGLNSAGGSNVYQQLMGRMPLGPQM